MAPDRNHDSRTSSGDSRASAEATPIEETQPARDKDNGGIAGPRAGRTGSQGSKAERPAEPRRGKDGTDEPVRTGKPPSPAASRGESGGRGLPQPVRDTAT